MSKNEDIKHDEFCLGEIKETEIANDIIKNVVDDDLLKILNLSSTEVTSEAHIDGNLRKTRSNVIIKVQNCRNEKCSGY